MILWPPPSPVVESLEKSPALVLLVIIRLQPRDIVPHFVSCLGDTVVIKPGDDQSTTVVTKMWQVAGRAACPTIAACERERRDQNETDFLRPFLPRFSHGINDLLQHCGGRWAPP